MDDESEKKSDENSQNANPTENSENSVTNPGDQKVPQNSIDDNSPIGGAENKEDFNQKPDETLAAESSTANQPNIKQEPDQAQQDDNTRFPTEAEKKNFKFGPYLDTLTWMEIKQIE